MNGYASLTRVELDGLNRDLVTQKDLRYSEREIDSGKTPEEKDQHTLCKFWRLDNSEQLSLNEA